MGEIAKYLEWCKTAIANIRGNNILRAVIGNSACDLDSAASAVSFGYYLHKTSETDNAKTIPVLNINKEDYPLKTEVKHLFDKYGISSSFLHFKDDINLIDYKEKGKLEVVLVDRNTLSEDEIPLKPCITYIVDHHRKQWVDDERVKTKIEKVGSCSTLIAELILNSSITIDKHLAEMLYTTIILDTINLSKEADIVTEKDKIILNQLERKYLPNIDHTEIFNEYFKAKTDVSSLTLVEILRKDVKIINDANIKIGISSIPLPLLTFFNKDNVFGELREFSKLFSLNLVVIMVLFVTEDNTTKREIAVYSENNKIKEEVRNRNIAPPIVRVYSRGYY
ncbi:DgyrCDS11250 [Dimorphilus gyrociliatus]|uniref:DgyrCDS11250 n=1 Tax=Dimorphilus gyrociliatus TaxID=2664684 RepID=A0A7I8W3S0_9ANNE|nr:DgyrCDS11250 [Dimorphilus gyrociliatus]